MPFPKKWNMNPVSRMLEPILDLKQWVEGLVLQRPYSERAWVELVKGRWEARSHGLGKDVFMRPPSVDEEFPAQKKSSESAEVDKGALAIIPEQGKIDTIPSRAKMVEGETEGRTSRAADDISRDELGIVDITGSPQFSNAMIREANMLEGRSYEGIQESIDIRGFLDGLESAASEDITGFGGLSASVLHHEAFLRIREEHEAQVWNLTEKSDSYKLLSKQLLADLAAARDEHQEMAEQADELMAEGEIFKKNMDILALKKKVFQAQLKLVEAQLRAAKKNASVQIERVKELQHRLDLVTSDKVGLANELEVAMSKVVVARSEVAVARSEVTESNKRADAKVAQFRIDVEARSEALEEVSAQGFNVEAEIENAKTEETRARRLVFPEEDFDSSSEFEDGENPEDEASDEDQAT
ncbi:uncharacterized protein [Nicotiana tomentosiformis]|uniref:uncharacterized protein n=1 Tax=Nicotiana tomentosiformis TaxID=4098 RepID=UPI00388CA08F